MKVLIKNGNLVNPKTNFDGKCDILIENEKIVKISQNIDFAGVDEILDADGLLVMPGIVDIHTHLREPGFEFKEDIVSGTSSALAGGVTTAACMPNTNPVIDSAEMVVKLKELIENKSLINVKIISSITKGLKGLESAELSKNAILGVVGFSDDGRTTMNDEYMEKAFEVSSKYGIPVITHCEDHDLAKLYLDRPTPPEVEYKIVNRDIELAKKVNGRLHVAHVSTKESVSYVREAKKSGVKVTCEVTPHHFAISNEKIDTLDPYCKVNPPIRSKEHVKSIIEGIVDGTIDVIVTDHAPHEKSSKETNYEKASFGISGFETSFALSYSSLVKTGIISLNKLIDMMSVRPSEIISFNRGNLEEGSIADITIVDLNEKFVIDSSKFISKGKNTPFNGMEVFGKVKYTIVGGKILFKEDNLCL